MNRPALPVIGSLSLVSLCSFVWATPVLAQTLGQGTDNELPWWRVIGSLIFCLVLAGAAAFVLRDRIPMLRGLRPLLDRRRDGRLQLVESARIAQQVDVCLVRCDQEELLIAVSPQGATLLRTYETPAEVKEAEA